MTTPTIDNATRALEQEADRTRFEHLRPYEQVAVLLMTPNPYTGQRFHTLQYISKNVVKAGSTWAFSAFRERKQNYGKHPEYGQRLMAYARDLEKWRPDPTVGETFRGNIDQILAWRAEGADAVVVRANAHYTTATKEEKRKFPNRRDNQPREDKPVEPTPTVADAPAKSPYAPEPEPEEISIPVTAEPLAQKLSPAEISALNGRLTLVQMAQRVERIMAYAQQQQDALASIVDELVDVSEHSPPMFRDVLGKVAHDFREFRDLYNTAVTTYLRSL
jgi:hypothetical protein